MDVRKFMDSMSSIFIKVTKLSQRKKNVKHLIFQSTEVYLYMKMSSPKVASAFSKGQMRFLYALGVIT